MQSARIAILFLSLWMLPAVGFAAEPKEVNEFAKRGYDSFNQGKYDEAIKDFSEAIRLDPNPKHGGVYFYRGFTYQQQKKYAPALADYAVAGRLVPKEEAQTHQLMDAGRAECIRAIRATGIAPEILSIKLDEELKNKVVKKSQPIKLAANTEKTVEDTIRVQHSLTVTDGWKAEAEVRGKVSAWYAEVEAGLRGSIEKATSRNYGVETERKRSVTLKGSNKGPGVRVVWVDYYRTGVAKVKVDGVEIELPFEFREDFDLLSEEAR